MFTGVLLESFLLENEFLLSGSHKYARLHELFASRFYIALLSTKTQHDFSPYYTNMFFDFARFTSEQRERSNQLAGL